MERIRRKPDIASEHKVVDQPEPECHPAPTSRLTRVCITFSGFLAQQIDLITRPAAEDAAARQLSTYYYQDFMSLDILDDKSTFITKDT